MEEITVSQRKNKTLKYLKHIVKQYDKPEHILNIIIQSSDNKILLIKIKILLIKAYIRSLDFLYLSVMGCD